MMQSLTDVVDLEDLGMHSLDEVMREHQDISLDKDKVFPSWLRDYNQVNGPTLTTVTADTGEDAEHHVESSSRLPVMM